MSTNSAPAIYSLIPKIMADVDPIAKARKNPQGYNFRGIDDVYQALQAIMAKHCVFTTSEILDSKTETKASKSGGELTYRILKIKWTLWASDGSSVSTETIGEGMDSGDKASNKAMSVAHKYALLQVFMIPTAEPKDPENDSHEVAPKKPEPPKPEKFIATPPQLKKLSEFLDKIKVSPVDQALVANALGGVDFTRDNIEKALKEVQKHA